MRRGTWALATGAAVAAVAVALIPVARVGAFYDDGIYLALARSLAEGHGYRLLFLPGAPAAVHYPPLYPLFLAALWKLWPAFPDNVLVFRAANALALGLFAGGFAGYLARRNALPAPAAALVVAIGATAVPLLAVVAVLFAEPLFLVLAVGAWWLADAAADAHGRRALGLAAAAGVVAGLAALTRSIGVSVAAGSVIALLAARRRREAVAAAVPAILLLMPWEVWTAAHHAGVETVLAANYGTYGDLLRQAGFGVIGPDALWAVLRPLGNLAFATLPPAWHLVAGLPAVAVLVVGALALTRLAPAAGWSLACYLAVVACWPYAPDRFLWAVLPVLVVAFVLGALALRRAAVAQTGWRRWALGVAVAAGVVPALVGFGTYQVLGFRRGWPTSTQRQISGIFDTILPWVLAKTPPSAVLAGEDEPLLWLYSGRRAVPSHLWRLEGREMRSFGPDSLHAFLERSKVTHVILTGPGSDAAPDVDGLIGAYPGYLRTVMMWRGPMAVYAVIRGARPVPPPPTR